MLSFQSSDSGDRATQPLVRINDLEVVFRIKGGPFFRPAVSHVRAVDRVSLDIMPGETLGLVGESGSGKSTIGRTLLGIEHPTDGRMYFDGEDMTHLSGPQRLPLTRRMQMIFQDPYASVDPRMSVVDIVAEPLVIHRWGDRNARRERVLELLDLVGLSPRFAAAFPHQLSGGQRQRVGVARALALDPEFIICDEAVSALDVSIQAQIINLLLDLQAKLGLTYLFIAHDIAVVRHMAHRTMVLYLGQVMELGDSDAVVSSPLHPYTRSLMTSVPAYDPEVERARRLTHKPIVPDPLENLPAGQSRGCPFAPRCPLRNEVAATRGIDCNRVRPVLGAAAPDRKVACHLYEGSVS